jgi:antitoxin component HigA of HigAB toxin-antitoxin module|tara:strand:- start:177 stop:611 length:435 start_codon:yes stop_codon:yes gene_type:complete
MSQRSDSKEFVNFYSQQTMAKGTFDQVRMINNDLANMLAIVAGDPEITKKLKNPNEAQAMRQRQPVPVMSLRRYLRTYENHYKVLTDLERALGIRDANLMNIRRAVANFNRLDSRRQANTLSRLKQLLQAKLPNTDIQRKFKEL